jgi:hypothetical protein
VRWLFLGMILLFGLIVAGSQLCWVITDFGNPEYFALRQLSITK